MMQDRLDDIRSRLQAIGEELTDASIELLREAVEAGATERPPLDRTIGQARRAVDKAVRVLSTERVEPVE